MIFKNLNNNKMDIKNFIKDKKNKEELISNILLSLFSDYGIEPDGVYIDIDISKFRGADGSVVSHEITTKIEVTL